MFFNPAVVAEWSKPSVKLTQVETPFRTFIHGNSMACKAAGLIHLLCIQNSLLEHVKAVVYPTHTQWIHGQRP